MHDIEQPYLFGLTDAEKDRARRRVRKRYPKKKAKPVKSAAPGRTKAASEAEDVSAADELIDGVPQHVNTYHPDWMDEIGQAKNERLAAVLRTLAAEGAKPARMPLSAKRRLRVHLRPGVLQRTKPSTMRVPRRPAIRAGSRSGPTSSLPAAGVTKLRPGFLISQATPCASGSGGFSRGRFYPISPTPSANASRRRRRVMTKSP